jgi:hypothetical protein
MDNNFSNILNIFKQLDEGSMADAEKHQSGSHFGGYWKGTDKNPPKPGQGVGGCEESVEECDAPMSLADKLRARWEETKQAKGLQEYGAVGATGSTGQAHGQAVAPDPATQAKDISLAQQNLNKLKSAGVNLPTGVGQAAKSAVANTTDPTKVPTSQDKNVSMNLGGAIEQMLTKANPGQVQQVANAIKQANQGQ